LLGVTEQLIALLRKFSTDDQQLIREVLSTITSGQELDLQRLGPASAQNIIALQTDVELDDYTYRCRGLRRR